MAKAIAKEKWSKEFFETLKENNQVHIEQPGNAILSVTIGGKSTELKTHAMRDHSYGKREWSYMNRHFWLMSLFEDGSHLNANMVSYPAVKRLETGYMIDSGTISVEESGLTVELPQKDVPEEFSYIAKLTTGEEIEVKCTKEMAFKFDFPGYTIYEGIGTFDLNGKKGRGILEFGYNQDPGRVPKS